MTKQVTEKINTALLTIAISLCAYIYLDNKATQETNVKRVEIALGKFYDEYTNHCKISDTRLSAIEDEMSDFCEPPKRKKKTYRTLTE